MTIKQIMVGSLVGTLIVGAVVHKFTFAQNKAQKSSSILASRRSHLKVTAPKATREVSGKKTFFRSSRPS